MVKKVPKVASRWPPLPEGSSTMQTLFVPEVDDHRFFPDDMTKEELKDLSLFIEQSNKTLEVENMVFERYLSRMDPSALAKMEEILEAAAIALQKAERTVHLGGATSVVSLTKDNLGSRVTDDSSETSRSETFSGSTRSGVLGVFSMSDKGVKIQFAQKIEIVNREIDELKAVLENFRNKARKTNYLLRCRNEEISTRLQEVNDALYYFEHKLLVEGLDPMTGRLPGEKFLRYLETKLRAEEMEIDKMRIKTGSLRVYLNKLLQQLSRKEELGETLHAIDFQQLEIENRECQEILEGKVCQVNRIKRVNGNYGTTLNAQKKKLNEQLTKLAALEQISNVKNEMIKKFVTEEARIKSEIENIRRASEKITKLMKSYTVPEVIEYIKKKYEVYQMDKEIKVQQRKTKIEELVLASQAHKLKMLNTESSRNLIMPSMSRVLY